MLPAAKMTRYSSWNISPCPSLVPRPPLAAFFAAVEKHAAAKKAVRGGLGTRLMYLSMQGKL